MAEWIGKKGWGIGIRNQEGLDFDNKGNPPADELFNHWKELVEAQWPGLVDRLTIETTPSGGYHAAYKCPTIEGNQKLATRPATPEEKAQDPTKEEMTLIETRGLGGQFMVAPSPGYKVIQRGWPHLMEITPEEREILLDCARALHIPKEKPKRENGKTPTIEGDRPGDIYNQQHTKEALELLQRIGWTTVYSKGEITYLRRPGKKQGVSATFNYLGSNVLYVFSSNASPFEMQQSYSPFAIYTTLEHGGDFGSATKSLANRFGLNGKKPASKVSESSPKESTKHKTRWSAAELIAAEFEEPDYSIPIVLPSGVLAILAGRPKLGKSWLALQWAAAVGHGAKIWGMQAKKGKVLFIALEDNARRISKRIKTQQWESAGDVIFEFAWPDLNDGGLTKLERAIVEENYNLVIIDTISRFAKFKQRETEEATDAIGSIQRLALEFGCTILLIDHHRKPAGNVGDVVDDVMESTGKTAVADTIIGLYKSRGETVATLKATGRDQDDKELALKWDGIFCCWQFLGDAQEVAKTSGQQVLLGALKEFGGEATLTQLVNLTGKDKGYLSRVAGQLLVAGAIEQPNERGPYKVKDRGQQSQHGQHGQDGQESQQAGMTIDFVD